MQRSHPFGINEKRFSWKKNFGNGNDFKIKEKIKGKRKDNLEGGLGKFLMEERRDRRFLNHSINASHSLSRIKKLHDNDLKQTRRVIYPASNNEPQRPQKKKTYQNSQRTLRFSREGCYFDLIEKTPKFIPIKGKKRMHRDYNQNRERYLGVFGGCDNEIDDNLIYNDCAKNHKMRDFLYANSPCFRGEKWLNRSVENDRRPWKGASRGNFGGLRRMYRNSESGERIETECGKKHFYEKDRGKTRIY